MWKFIVMWCLSTVVSDPCPDANKVDEFGRKSSPFTTCAVFHFHIEKDCNHSKEFFSRKSAFEFYGKAKKEEIDTEFFMNSGIVDIKIDSVYIEVNN